MIETKLKPSDYRTSFNEFVFNLVPQKSKVLDVGCWNGNLGAGLIEEKGCTVDGIDNDADVLSEAKTRGYRNVYKIDLNSSTIDFSDVDRYDCIVFADVLEHLINPLEVLKDLSDHLHRNGKIIISLPNVAFALNRFNLLLGKWDYTKYGTLDKTHLRFFTLKTAAKLIEESGLELKSINGYGQFGILKKLNFLNNFLPSLFGYQILIEAKKK